MAMTKEQSEAGNVRIDFGKKHPNEPLWLVVDTDPDYIEWLGQQEWLKEPRYSEFYEKFLLYTGTADVQAKLHKAAFKSKPHYGKNFNPPKRIDTRL